jgi:hypothetical protein
MPKLKFADVVELVRIRAKICIFSTLVPGTVHIWTPRPKAKKYKAVVPSSSTSENVLESPSPVNSASTVASERVRSSQY